MFYNHLPKFLALDMLRGTRASPNEIRPTKVLYFKSYL